MSISSIFSSNYNLINNMNKASQLLAKSTARLSRGSILPTDNPVAYSQASRLESNIRTNSVYQKNIQDGITAIQMAGNTLDSVTDLVSSLKELAVQYKNGNLSDSDKSNIQKQAKDLTTEIINQLKNTTMNGKSLFDKGSLNVSIGNGQGISINIPKLFQTGSNSVANTKTGTNVPSGVTSPLDSVVDTLENATYEESPIILSEGNSESVQVMTLMSTVATTSTSGTTSISSFDQSDSSRVRYTLPSLSVSIPDQKGYSGYKKITDSKGDVIYEGNLTNGTPDGYGKVYGINGKLVYEGAFSNGQYNGYGTLYGTNGKMLYQGDIKDGVPDGYGTVYDTNGKMEYQGGLKNGYRQGWGTTYGANGKVIESKEYSDAPSSSTGNSGGSVDNNTGSGNGSNSGNVGNGGSANDGGSTNTGSDPNTGGSTNTGGTSNNGGNSGTGGVGDNGDTSNTGGSPNSSDGASNNNGSTNTGGSNDNGGNSSTGNTNSGDNTTGGNTGGDSSGNSGAGNPVNNGGTNSSGGSNSSTGDSSGSNGSGNSGSNSSSGNTGSTGGTSDGGSSSSIDWGNLNLNDLLNMNPDDLLNTDLLDKISDALNSTQTNISFQENLLARHSEWLSNQNVLEEERFNRITSIDEAKEVMNQVKLQMQQQVSYSLMMQNLSNYRSFITTLLQG